jgi:hypothetical protein
VFTIALAMSIDRWAAPLHYTVPSEQSTSHPEMAWLIWPSFTSSTPPRPVIATTRIAWHSFPIVMMAPSPGRGDVLDPHDRVAAAAPPHKNST